MGPGADLVLGEGVRRRYPPPYCGDKALITLELSRRRVRRHTPQHTLTGRLDEVAITPVCGAT
jgi:hypothetical protein